ncbi:MAG: hypothetical protein K9L59_18390 [Desulfobacterales bacterium]|nr:hypothetical protein [Desulfobacterales bacterium]
MMYQQMPRYELPETVDDLADLLLSDLTVEHKKALSSMNRAEFEQMYLAVAEALLDEFDLWTGNDKLLASCMAEAGESDPDDFEPARIVLEKMRNRMVEEAYIYVVT